MFSQAILYPGFNLIAGSIIPFKLIVTLKGQSKDAQSSLAGIYVLEPNPINDKPHWLQNSGSEAIWYNKYIKDIGIWAIGSRIISFDDVSSPQEATTWQYFDGKDFVVSDDIMVDTFVEAGTCILCIMYNI